MNYKLREVVVLLLAYRPPANKSRPGIIRRNRNTKPSAPSRPVEVATNRGRIPLRIRISVNLLPARIELKTGSPYTLDLPYFLPSFPFSLSVRIAMIPLYPYLSTSTKTREREKQAKSRKRERGTRIVSRLLVVSPRNSVEEEGDGRCIVLECILPVTSLNQGSRDLLLA